ncbi:metallophosphoesterase family protein [Shimia biformata]|uniref:metallophosphoesterase family protein n=1 Tax=Shimia biformata TaxID=1294299 RepID=UPI00194F57CB|nr:metallophosphoesterase family protein [Shimia biformata]
MRILAFSDMHGSARVARQITEASAKADLVIGAGDFCNARQGLNEAMQALSGIEAPLVLVPGNAESAGELAEAAPTGATVLHGAGVTVGKLTVFGLGYGIPETPFGAWSCDMSEDEAAAMLDHCDRADILVLHSPPKGLADRTSRGESVGSTAIRDAIERVQPQLAVCGHVHDCWGVKGKIGATTVFNLGPRPNWFNLDRRRVNI